MGKDQKELGKKCFIITPIGDATSETFRMAKGVIESAIKPVLQKYGYDDIKPAYEINQTGMINTQIINRIIDDDLVIANLTGNNPNVMYELCLRHVTAKPIIHICQNGTTLPFDIKDSRTIFFQNDMLGVRELKDQMELFVQEIDYFKEYNDNPIYNAQRVGRLLKEVPKEGGDKIEVELLQNILSELSNLRHSDFATVQIHHSAFEVIYKEIYMVMFSGVESAKTKKVMIKELDEELLSYQFCKLLPENGYLRYQNQANHPLSLFEEKVDCIATKYGAVYSIKTVLKRQS